MLVKDEGVVLRVARSGESSLLVTFLSRGMGKVRLLAKGVLGPRQPSRGMLDVGNHLEALFYYKEGRNVYYLKEASLLSPPWPNRESLPHLAACLAVAELLDQVCYAGGADESVLDLAVDFVRAGGGDDPLLLFLAFELKLLMSLGTYPELTRCAVCGDEVAGGEYDAREGESRCSRHTTGIVDGVALSGELLLAARECTDIPLEELSRKTIRREARKELGKLVHWTYTYHVQGYSLPKSLTLI